MHNLLVIVDEGVAWTAVIYALLEKNVQTARKDIYRLFTVEYIHFLHSDGYMPHYPAALSSADVTRNLIFFACNTIFIYCYTWGGRTDGVVATSSVEVWRYDIAISWRVSPTETAAARRNDGPDERPMMCDACEMDLPLSLQRWDWFYVRGHTWPARSNIWTWPTTSNNKQLQWVAVNVQPQPEDELTDSPFILSHIPLWSSLFTRMAENT